LRLAVDDIYRILGVRRFVVHISVIVSLLRSTLDLNVRKFSDILVNRSYLHDALRMSVSLPASVC